MESRRAPLACLKVFLAAGALSVPIFGCAAPRGAGSLEPRIVPHSTWDAQPPVGHEANAIRRNIGAGETLQFDELTLELRNMIADSSGAVPVDRAVVELRRGSEAERKTVHEGAAFNWSGYHIAILAVNTRPDELGAGLVELEVGTLESLPPSIAEATRAGDATYRIRIPHEIESITLHHSGSPEPLRPSDDPVRKLQDLQEWGQQARNWWDVPYHFLVDLDGNIYEGRDYHYMGETNTDYDPTGHFLISILGNYNLQEPTPEQLDAIMDLMAWAVAEFDVPIDRIYGHGDLAETSCPGANLRKYLDDGTFRRGVMERLAAAGVRE